MTDFETNPVGTLAELAKVKEERDALAAHVERLTGALVLARNRIELLANVATDHGAAVYAALDVWPEEMAKTLAETPYTSLARLKVEWQAEVLEEAGRYIRCEEDAALLRINAQELRRQAEGGE